MKKTFFMLLVVVLPLIASAQQVKETVIVEEEAGSWRGFVTNRFWDNWFISAGAGGQVYFGERDHHSRFGRRITPAFNIAVGKWFMPTFGVRLQAGGFTLKGLTDDPNNIYVKGAPDNRGLYKQEWDQFNIHVDGMVNLANWIGGYRTDRFYETVFLAGFGMAHAYTGGGSTKFMFVSGINNKFRISDAFDFNLDINGHLVPQEFDGQVDNHRAEGFVSVTVGFTYKFKDRFFRKERKEIVNTGVSPAMLTAAESRLADAISRIGQLEDELAQARRKEQTPVVKQEVEAPALYVFFAINKANIDKRQMENLKSYAEIIKKSPDKKYKVFGYADKATGSAAFNQALSEKRARNVADILVKKFGVNANQLQVVGKGGVSDFSDKAMNRVVIVD